MSEIKPYTNRRFRKKLNDCAGNGRQQFISCKTNPERANGQAHSRGGEANTNTEIDTGLAFPGPHGLYRLWLPNGWFDWSVFHLGDTDGEEET